MTDSANIWGKKTVYWIIFVCMQNWCFSLIDCDQPESSFSVKCRYLNITKKKPTIIQHIHQKKNKYRIHKKCELISHKCVSWHKNANNPISVIRWNWALCFFFFSFRWMKNKYLLCKNKNVTVAKKKTEEEEEETVFYKELFTLSL